MSFNTIYFDSSILIAGGWPTLSGELTTLIVMAKTQKVEIIIPLAVEAELEERWVREVEKARNEMTARVDNFNRHTKSISPPIKGVMPSAEELRRQYREKIEAMKKRMQIAGIPLSNRSLQSVYEMAIKLTPPFEEKGVGFKDTIILLSVIDHLEANADRQGAFIAQDQIFAKAPIAELCSSAKDRIQFYKEPKKLVDVLLERMAKPLVDSWRADRRAIEAILDQKRDELKRFIEANLEVDTYQLPDPGVIDLIKSVEVSEIHKNTLNPPFPRPENGKEAQITFDVDVILHVVVSRMPSFKSRPLRVGELTPAIGLINSEILAPRQEEEALARTVRVEAAAAFNKEYTDIRFLSVSLKPVGLLGLGLGT